ncbi:unnamed protein product [Auanema sp. JU1783]|nr:unnamed protein product [Auanema sp. JU1783]
MPEPDLTNSIYNHRNGIEPIDYEVESSNNLVEGGKSAENVDEPSMSPYRKMTFRRRNINNAGFLSNSGLSPFNRMSYKSAYGSNRGSSSYYRNRMSNYGNMNNNFANVFSNNGDAYKTRGPFQSGLMGGTRNSGYYGSISATRNKYKTRPMDAYAKNSYGSNDLMSSFNSMPNAFASKPYIPAMGHSSSFIPAVPEQGRYPSGFDYMSTFDNRPSASMRRENDPFKNQIKTNSWAGTFRSPADSDEAVIDGYADAIKKKTS